MRFSIQWILIALLAVATLAELPAMLVRLASGLSRIL